MARILPQPADRNGATSLRTKSSTNASLLVCLSGAGDTQSAYSVAKFLDLQRYASTVCYTRIVWLCVTTPLPGLLAAIAPTLLPLQNPLLGVSANGVFFVHVFMIVGTVSIGAILHTRAGAQIPSELYNGVEMGLASIGVGVFHVAMMYPICRFWRFPMPLMWIIGTPFFMANVLLAHVVVLRHKIVPVARYVKRYLVPFMIQTSQVVLYPAFSVLFEHGNELTQVLLTLAFPILKFAMKRILRRHTRGLKDFSAEVAVSGIEICASLYQAMIMQGQPSYLATGIIMGVDVVQGLFAVKFFMDKKTSVPQRELVGRAARILATHGIISNDDLDNTDKPIEQPTKNKDDVRSPTTTTSRMRDEDREIVRQALELTSAAESILLVEYFEVMIPVISCLFIVIASQFPSARYNDRLVEFYYHPSVLGGAVQSVLVYACLQGVSFVAMHVVMRRRYDMSAVRQLSFILERHQYSIQGKMIAWLTIILHFTVVHYGTDFLFQFDFEAKVHKLLNE